MGKVIEEDNKPLYNIKYLHGKSDRRGIQAKDNICQRRAFISDSIRKLLFASFNWRVLNLFIPIFWTIRCTPIQLNALPELNYRVLLQMQQTVQLRLYLFVPRLYTVRNM